MMCEIFQKELIDLSNEVYPDDQEKIKKIINKIFNKIMMTKNKWFFN